MSPSNDDPFVLEASNSYEEIEAVPNLEVPDGSGESSRSYEYGGSTKSKPAAAPRSGGGLAASASSETVPSSLSHLEAQTATDSTVVVTRRMTAFEFFVKSQVRSQTSNRTVIATFDKILMFLLLVASWVEEPLNYMVRNLSTGGNDSYQRSRSKSGKPTIRAGMVETALGSMAYISSQPKLPTKVPILCFHAEDRSSDEFRDILPLLAQRGRRVIAVDLLGYGKSQNPSRPTITMDEWVDTCREVADSLMIDQFVCLGSHGLGTAISLLLATRFPQRVRSCIHINLVYQPTNNTPPSSDSASNVTQPTTSVSDPSALLDEAMSALYDFAFREDGSHWRSLHEHRNLMDPELNLRCLQSDIEWINLYRRRKERLEEVYHDDKEIQRMARLPAWYRAVDWDRLSLKLKSTPQLCVSGEATLARWNAKGWAGTQRFDSACRLLGQCEVTSLTGPTSTRYLLNMAPQELVSLANVFLDKHSL